MISVGGMKMPFSEFIFWPRVQCRLGPCLTRAPLGFSEWVYWILSPLEYFNFCGKGSIYEKKITWITLAADLRAINGHSGLRATVLEASLLNEILSLFKHLWRKSPQSCKSATVLFRRMLKKLQTYL